MSKENSFYAGLANPWVAKSIIYSVILGILTVLSGGAFEHYTQIDGHYLHFLWGLSLCFFVPVAYADGVRKNEQKLDDIWVRKQKIKMFLACFIIGMVAIFSGFILDHLFSWGVLETSCWVWGFILTVVCLPGAFHEGLHDRGKRKDNKEIQIDDHMEALK